MLKLIFFFVYFIFIYKFAHKKNKDNYVRDKNRKQNS